MAFPIAIPVAISAVKALIRFRGQLDTILSQNVTTTGLPFALPPAPTDDARYLKDMLGFFSTDQGKMVLHLRGLAEEFKNVEASPHSTDASIDEKRKKLFELYYLAADVRPDILGPSDPGQAAPARGPSADMRLAYFVVESQRLSRNMATVRVLLATADTLLEFTGENAGLFISNPQTRSLIENLIEEFAGKRNFDDDGIETIFKSLLGATLAALANHPGDLVNKPAMKALFAALGDVRDKMGNNFAAEIISMEGFEKLVASYATFAAKDPSFMTDNVYLQQVLSAMLGMIGSDFPKMVKDPKAFLGILEAGLGAATAHVNILLKGKLEGQPVLAAVLKSVCGEVEALAHKNALFKNIGSGQLIADIYKTGLQAVAANPVLFSTQNDTNKFISSLLSGLASALAQKDLSTLFSEDTLRALASESLVVLSANATFLTGHHEFATNLLAAVFQSGAKSIKDGVTKDDLIDIAKAALKAASENIALVRMDARFAAIISSFCNACSGVDSKQLTTAQGRKDLVLISLQVVAANPQVWGQWEEKKLAQPLVEAVLAGLKEDPTQLLSGPVLVDAVRRILISVARRGNQIISKSVSPEVLKNILLQCLKRANQEIGKTVDGENLPLYLERAVISFMAVPGMKSAEMAGMLDGVIAGL